MRIQKPTLPGVATHLLFALLFAASSLLAPAARAQHGFERSGALGIELRPGILVDADRGRVFSANADGHLEAIDTTTGELLFVLDDEAYKPLALSGDRLLVARRPSQPGNLPLALFDASNGRLLRQQRVELPAEVMALLVDGLGSSFRIETTAGGTSGQLELRWHFEHQRISGAAIAKKVPKVEQRGKVRVSPDGMIMARALPADEPVQPPDPVLLDTDQRVKGLAERQFRSVDDAFVLTSKRGKGVSGPERYRWQVYSREGQRVGQIAAPTAYAPFTVIDALVLHTVEPSARRIDGEMVDFPAMLRAVDALTGVVQWQRPIRDITYRGPFPP